MRVSSGSDVLRRRLRHRLLAVGARRLGALDLDLEELDAVSSGE